HLLARLLDDPADGLRRVRRRADLAPDVLARPERELPEPLLTLAEGLVRRVELAHPARQPDRTLFDHAEAEPREAVEDAVNDQRREGQHGREGDRHEVHRAEVLRAAVEVGDEWQPVLEVARIDERP